jgi:hypothetical protein
MLPRLSSNQLRLLRLSLGRTNSGNSGGAETETTSGEGETGKPPFQSREDRNLLGQGKPNGLLILNTINGARGDRKVIRTMTTDLTTATGNPPEDLQMGPRSSAIIATAGISALRLLIAASRTSL